MTDHPKEAERVKPLLDPDMPSDELRLHLGEMTPAEVRAARAAIRWANSRAESLAAEADRADALERRLMDGVSAMRRAKEFVLEAGRKRASARMDALREAAAALRPAPALFGPFRAEDECRSRCADAVLALSFAPEAGPRLIPGPRGGPKLPSVREASVPTVGVAAWRLDGPSGPSGPLQLTAEPAKPKKA